MLPEFAIVPIIFDKTVVGSKETANILIRVLGDLSEYGLVAETEDKKWHDQVNKKINELEDNKLYNLKNDIQRQLSRLMDRKRLICHIRPTERIPETDNDWIELWLDIHENSQKLEGIILNESLIKDFEKNDIFIEFISSVNSVKWEKLKKHSFDFKKTKSEFKRHLYDILKYAKKLWLIDPYFNISEQRFRETAVICSKSLGSCITKKEQCKIIVHTDKEHQTPDYKESWKKELEKLKNSYNHDYQVSFWEKKGEHWHDRHLITDQVGIDLSSSLDFFNEKRASYTTWTIMDYDSRGNKLERFAENTSPFNLVHKITL